MREKWARRIAFLTGLLVMLLAIMFATIQNPEKISASTKSDEQSQAIEAKKVISLDIELIETGRQIFKQKNCFRCHSIAGAGNPRYPLDGVGASYNTNELRDWIIGADNVRDMLPAHVFKLKQSYSELSDDDLKSLIEYLQSLRMK